MALAVSEPTGPDFLAAAGSSDTGFTLPDPEPGASIAPDPATLGPLTDENGNVIAQAQVAQRSGEASLWTSSVPGVPDVTISGSRSFRSAVSAQLDTLAGTATGRAQLSQLGSAARNAPIYVMEGEANLSGVFRNDSGRITGNAVVLDSRYAGNPNGASFRQQDGTVIPMPMYVIIGHELGHLNGIYTGANRAEGAAPYSDVFDREENRVIRDVENPLRREAGLPPRTQYYGNFQY